MITRFAHISTDKTTITRENFIPPAISKALGLTHELQPPGNCLYLSQVNPDNTTDWEIFCQENKQDYYSWTRGTKTFFEVNFVRAKILVIKDLDDVYNLIMNYCVFKYIDKTNNTGTIDLLSKSIDDYKREIEICDQLLAKLSNHSELIVNYKPVYDELNKKFVYQPHLPSIHRIQLKLELLLEEEGFQQEGFQQEGFQQEGFQQEEFQEELEIDSTFVAGVLDFRHSKIQQLKRTQSSINRLSVDSMEFLRIDYRKMKRRDGYSGIYYTKEIIENRESINSIDISELYKRHGQRENTVLDDFVNYFCWLRSDTLILWNIDNVDIVS